MVAALTPIGTGLYSVKEAAMYARVQTSMMLRWVFGNSQGQSVIQAQYGQSDDKIISFLDLIQTLAIREIRNQRRVPLEKIRFAIRECKAKFNIDFPFARKHTVFIDNQGELVINPVGNEFIQLTGKHQGQRLFEFVQMYLGNLSFDGQGLANEYRIFSSSHPSPVVIKMNPDLRFGEPLLPSRFSVFTIWEAIQAEGTIEKASQAYGIPVQEVEAAYQFYDAYGNVPKSNP